MPSLHSIHQKRVSIQWKFTTFSTNIRNLDGIDNPTSRRPIWRIDEHYIFLYRCLWYDYELVELDATKLVKTYHSCLHLAFGWQCCSLTVPDNIYFVPISYELYVHITKPKQIMLYVYEFRIGKWAFHIDIYFLHLWTLTGWCGQFGRQYEKYLWFAWMTECPLINCKNHWIEWLHSFNCQW